MSTADFFVSMSTMLMCPLLYGKAGGGMGKAPLALERSLSRVEVVTGGGGDGMAGDMLPVSPPLYFLLSM